jgi:all-trans-8'-apo-beta-carotenal 15,15'-oxygenase
VVEQHAHTVPGFALLHDVAVTPNYYVFFQGPLTIKPVPYLLGTRTIGECLRTNEREPTRVWVFPRHGRGSMYTLHTDPCFIFHHANAWESDGAIVVDSVLYDSFPLLDPRAPHMGIDFANIPAGQLWRFHLDLQTGTVERQRIHQRSCEFPVLHAAHVGRPYRYMYLGARDEHAANGPYQALIKVDLAENTSTEWSAAPHGFVNEPLFVPRGGPARCTALAAPPDPIHTLDEDAEDDGWLITLTYEADQHRSDVVILDARDIAHGPIARLRLRHHVPFGLHGSFTPQRFGPEL